MSKQVPKTATVIKIPNTESEQADEADHAPAEDGSLATAFERELAAAMQKADENHDKYLRAAAELENFRRRSERLRDDAVLYARRSLLLGLLDVADNLERALKHADADPASLREGVDGTYRAFLRLLEREGAAPIGAENQPFNPDLHEAVAVVPVPGEGDDKVIAVERTGYTLQGDLLRPAQVVVGRPGGGGG